MLRLSLGMAWGPVTLTDKADTSKLSLDGGHTSLTVDLGVSLVENAILQGRLSIAASNRLSAKRNDEEPAVEGPDYEASRVLFGPGFTYYFSPINIYATAVAGVEVLNIYQDGARSDRASAGLGLQLDAGWEAWVSSDWAIGLGARFDYVRVEDRSIREHYEFVGLGVFLSATYQ